MPPTKQEKYFSNHSSDLYTINHAREQVPVPKKMELKDKLDIVFRSIGLIAIGIPIFLFYLQQRASLKSQKTLQQLEVYASTVTEKNSLLTRSPIDSAFQKSRNRFCFELVPKIASLFNDELGDSANALVQDMDAYAIAVRQAVIARSLFRDQKPLSDFLCSYVDADNEADGVAREHLTEMHNIDSLFEIYLSGSLQLTKLIKQDSSGQSLSSNAFVKLQGYASKIDSSLLPFLFCCKPAMEILQKKQLLGKKEDYAYFCKTMEKSSRQIGTVSGLVLDNWAVLEKDLFRQLKTKFKSLLYSLKSMNKI